MKRRATQQTLLPFAKQVAADMLPAQWSYAHKTVLLRRPSADVVITRMAGFDLDGTLITTRSGNTFPRDENDWRLLSARVPQRMRELVSDGFHVVVFSNQLGVAKGRADPHALCRKVDRVMRECGLEDHVWTALMATQEDGFRKPLLGMLQALVTDVNGGRGLDVATSFYCGDAAGRVDGWAPGRKKDFACTDRKVAANAGLVFRTPEALFDGVPEAPEGKWAWGSFNARAFLEAHVARQGSAVGAEAAASSTALASSDSDACPVAPSSEREVLLLVGLPGSGKSFIAESLRATDGLSHAYVVVSLDVLKTRAKCLEAAAAALRAGKSVVVDNTNVSRAARAPFVQLAANEHVTVRCAVMQTEPDVCEHLNIMRELCGVKERVPSIAMRKLRSEFEAPSADEGIGQIVEVPFAPRFKTPEQVRLFTLFLQ